MIAISIWFWVCGRMKRLRAARKIDSNNSWSYSPADSKHQSNGAHYIRSTRHIPWRLLANQSYHSMNRWEIASGREIGNVWMNFQIHSKRHHTILQLAQTFSSAVHCSPSICIHTQRNFILYLADVAAVYGDLLMLPIVLPVFMPPERASTDTDRFGIFQRMSAQSLCERKLFFAAFWAWILTHLKAIKLNIQ